jgi:hypothetical protein
VNRRSGPAVAMVGDIAGDIAVGASGAAIGGQSASGAVVYGSRDAQPATIDLANPRSRIATLYGAAGDAIGSDLNGCRTLAAHDSSHRAPTGRWQRGT